MLFRIYCTLRNGVRRRRGEHDRIGHLQNLKYSAWRRNVIIMVLFSQLVFGFRMEESKTRGEIEAPAFVTGFTSNGAVMDVDWGCNHLLFYSRRFWDDQ